MVSRLVTEDEGNRTLEEEIGNGSEGPDVSKRVQMEMAISRLTTAQITGDRPLFTDPVLVEHIVVPCPMY